MSDLAKRIAALSPAKRALLMFQLSKQGIAHRVGPPGGMTVADLSTEAVLDPRIDPQSARAPIGGEADAIFLTGATGFVGAFLLEELLKQTRATIYCLVRASGPAEARRRIQDNLTAYLVWREEYHARIVPVAGDLSQSGFGLAAELLNDLADRLDAVYHCGALVKWTYPYSALKAANVLGTQEILRLASQVKVKPVHFVSTIGVFSSPVFASDVVREEDDLESSGPLYVGYAQSKWVAEKLVGIARSRGLPVVVYRPGTGGHSRTGAFNEADHICRMIKGCIELGSAPDLDLLLQLAPVDYVCRAMVHLARRKESFGKTFHLVNPCPLSWNALVGQIQEFGYPLEHVSYDTWRTRLLDQVKSSRASALYALSPFISEAVLDYTKLPRFDCQQTLAALAEASVHCPPLDSDLLRTYFRGFVQRGFLKAPIIPPGPGTVAR